MQACKVWCVLFVNKTVFMYYCDSHHILGAIYTEIQKIPKGSLYLTYAVCLLFYNMENSAVRATYILLEQEKYDTMARCPRVLERYRRLIIVCFFAGKCNSCVRTSQFNGALHCSTYFNTPACCIIFHINMC